jgi:hypothetical protein
MQNWSDVLNINYYGCDVYPVNYVSGPHPKLVHTKYGHFYLPVCYSPIGRPAVSSLVFVLFILVCGFILVSLTVAFVTTGINTKLSHLKEVEEAEETKMENESVKSGKTGGVLHGLRRKSVLQNAIRSGILNSEESDKSISSSMSVQQDTQIEKTPSLLYNSNQPAKAVDPDTLRALLLEVWSQKGGGILKKEQEDTDKPGSPSATSAKKRKGKLEKFFLWLGVKMKTITSNRYYNYVMFTAIVFAAIIEILSLENKISAYAANSCSIGIQIVFTIDLLIKLAATAPKYSLFIDDAWNNFDILIVLLLWIPVVVVGSSANDKYFGKCD